jgi:hypothetical protein
MADELAQRFNLTRTGARGRRALSRKASVDRSRERPGERLRTSAALGSPDGLAVYETGAGLPPAGQVAPHGGMDRTGFFGRAADPDLPKAPQGTGGIGRLMPFIVTTKQPHGGGVVPFILSRQAVATLPDAQRVLRDAVRDADWPRDIGGSNARQSVSGQIDDLMASGGNAIRLPDGRIIEVLAVDDAEYARAIDAGMNGPAVPGVAEGRPMRSEPRSSEGEESREPREHCACGGFWRGAIDGPYAVCASCGATREDPPVPDPAPIRGQWTITPEMRARFDWAWNEWYYGPRQERPGPRMVRHRSDARSRKAPRP